MIVKSFLSAFMSIDLFVRGLTDKENRILSVRGMNKGKSTIGQRSAKTKNVRTNYFEFLR